MQSTESAPFLPPIVILTAIPLEYLAVRAHLSNIREDTHPRGNVYERGTFSIGFQTWDVAIVKTGAGNVDVASAVERAVNYYNATTVFFVGVAGGIKDVKLGDVVVSTKVYGYESGKAEKTFKVRPSVGLSSFRLEQRAEAEVRKPDWLQYVQGPIATPPHVYVAPIAAGEKVVASTRSATWEFICTNYNDALAIEMEGYGFLRAVHTMPNVEAIVIRGISDLVNGKQKADAAHSQETAARNASAFAFAILSKLPSSSSFPLEKLEHLHVEHVYIDEREAAPVIDITLRNKGSQDCLLIGAKIDIVDVSEFYDYDEDDTLRAYLPESQTYSVKLSPELKRQSIFVKLSHLLQANEPDRFRWTLESELSEPSAMYVWYHLKITLVCADANDSVELKPLLLSLPPVNMRSNNVWKSTSSACAERNKANLIEMSKIEAQRSDSVHTTIQFLRNTY